VTGERVTLAIGDTCHAVLKLLAAARAVTLTDLAEGLLCDGLRREFERDPHLKNVVRELVMRDERADVNVRQRTVELLDTLARSEKEGEDEDG
jgi:hypothetical protein